MGGLSPEDIVTVTDVGEHHRQHDDCSHQEQRLRFGCSSRLPERNLEGHDIGPRADGNAKIARQKYTKAEEKRPILPVPMQIAPNDDQEDQTG